MNCAAPGCDRPRNGKHLHCNKHRQEFRNNPENPWHKHRKPSPDGLCLCGCGKPTLPHSAYAGQSCHNRMNRRRKRANEEKVEYYHHNPAIVLGVHAKQRGATVEYHDGGLADHVSAATATRWLVGGMLEPGDTVTIGDKRTVVEAQQAELL